MSAAVRKVPREEAVARACAERGAASCLMCEVLERTSDALTLERGRYSVAFVVRYALRPGHCLVTLREHVTAVSDLDEAAWLEASAMARRAAIALARVLAPSRCFVASLGTNGEVPMSSEHVHIHVVPVEAGARPAAVYTWEHGVYVGDDPAWHELASRLRSAWPR